MDKGSFEKLQELLSWIGAMERPDCLVGGLGKFVQDMGFQAFTHVGLRGLGSNGNATPYVTTVRSDWEEHYQTFNLVQNDPVLSRCVTGTTPVAFTDLDATKLTADQQTMMDHARDFKMEKGVCIPVHGPSGSLSLFSVYHIGNQRTYQEASHSLPLLTMAAMHVHEKLMKLGQPPVPPPTSLSARETECLLWSAEGKTAWEISQILGVSERTVKFHMMNVMRKLGVHSRTHAVARAISLGLAKP